MGSAMRDGICPKCGGNDIRTGRHWACRRDFLAASLRGNPARVINYVCTSCGYLENYVDPADLETFAKRWKRVGPAGKLKPVGIDPDV
jgi:hypothetical protein